VLLQLGVDVVLSPVKDQSHQPSVAEDLTQIEEIVPLLVVPGACVGFVGTGGRSWLDCSGAAVPGAG